jgi:CBS domain-containing protein
MVQTVTDVMTRNPASIERGEPAAEAARLMAQGDMGEVVVLDNGTVVGVVTDRDIAVRLVAEEKDPRTPVAEILSDQELVTVPPDMPLIQAVGMMRLHSVRRLPVLEKGRAVGIISLGDLAIERDETSALADISAAEGNV